jgi:uncharacterized membrane protein HdeD (DUF308 family)
VVGYGVVTIVIGLVLAVWPGETLVVLAVILSIQLMVNGIFQLINAFAAHTVDGGVRALLGLVGALSIIVALLCLRAPMQTVVVIGLLLGAWLVISGLIDVFTAVLSDSGERGWRMIMGIVSVAAGAFLLVNPELSLGALVIVMAVWLFGYGAIAIIAGLRLRSLRTEASA